MAIGSAHELELSAHDLNLGEEELRASEARYRLLAEHAAAVIWVLDISTMQFTYVSPSVEKLRGYTPEEVFAQSKDQVLTPESLATVQAILPARIQAFLAGDPAAASRRDELEQFCKDGSTVWTEVTTTFVLQPDGALQVVGVSRDISARKRAERQLMDAQQTLEARVAARTAELTLANPI
jgi:PAS domain S-box-containing protein